MNAYPYKPASCATCPAACCRKNVRMPLTDNEVEFMRLGGTELERLTSEQIRGERIRRALGMAVTHDYRLATDCGYLVQDDKGQMSCIAHENEERPRICREFQENSYSCHVLRCRSGVEEPENLAKFDAATRE